MTDSYFHKPNSTPNPVQPRMLIMAGGTGGHILPALAVAKELQAYGIAVDWLGTLHGLEAQLIPPTGIPLHYIRMRGVRGKSWLRLLATPLRVLYATLQAMRIIHSLRPAAVLGFGGFVSAPGGIAAWLMRKPLVLHEQNAVAGMTNRCLAHLAKQVFQAFPATFPAARQAVTCGNPVRAEMLMLPSPQQRFASRLQQTSGPLRLLVVGGSQGATWFNQLIPAALALLPANTRPEVWHAAGRAALDKTAATYQQLQVSAQVTAFIEDMAAAYSWADLVVCRAGALTIAELAAAGAASILVPFPHAVDDHQTKNAAWMVQAGAAILLPQPQFTQQALLQLLAEFNADRPRLLQMAIAARQLAIVDATHTIVQHCLSRYTGMLETSGQL